MKQGSLNSVDPPRRPALVILGGVCLLGATITMIVSLVVGDSRQIGWLVAVLFVAFIVLVQTGKGRKPSPEAVRCSGCRHWLEPAPSDVLDRLKLGDRVRTCHKCQTCGEWTCEPLSVQRGRWSGCRTCGGHSFEIHQMVVV
jgi:hypothetical protein